MAIPDEDETVKTHPAHRAMYGNAWMRKQKRLLPGSLLFVFRIIFPSAGAPLG